MEVLTILCDEKTTNIVSFLLKTRWKNTRVRQCVDIENGLKFLEKESPHLVVIDLPNSFNRISTIREFTDAPLIVLIDKSQNLDGIQALEKGVDEFIFKPIDTVDFLARVNALLRFTYIPYLGSIHMSLPQFYHD